MSLSSDRISNKNWSFSE